MPYSSVNRFRRLLDEAGIHHEDGSDNTLVLMPGGFPAQVTPECGMLMLRMFPLSPEQALEAVRGEGACKWELVKHGALYDVFRCSFCGYEHVESLTDLHATSLEPRYCPMCRREVVPFSEEL